jgi:hypothetical protein
MLRKVLNRDLDRTKSESSFKNTFKASRSTGNIHVSDSNMPTQKNSYLNSTLGSQIDES